MNVKHFLVLCFAALAVMGCENTVMEELEPTTKALPSSYYCTDFLNLQETVTKKGRIAMSGDLEVNPIGAEYTFTLAPTCNYKQVEVIVSAKGATLYDKQGKSLGDQLIAKCDGKRTEYVIKITSAKANIRMEIDESTAPKWPEITDLVRVNARLVLGFCTYQGERLPEQKPSGTTSSDLVVYGTYN